jgi:phosphoglycerate dehydrogenase-like enzyme
LHPDKKPVLALTGAIAGEGRALIEQHLTTAWDICTWTPADGEDALTALLADADAVVPGTDSLFVGAFYSGLRASPNLRLLQIPFAGTDWLSPDLLPPQAVAAGCSGHEITMAEYTIAAMLEWEIRFRVMDPDFRSGSWHYSGSSKDPTSKHGEIWNKTVGIIGYGGIGEEIARRAKAFSMRTMGLKRSAMPCPAELDWLGASVDDPGALMTLLTESDYVVLACDLNDATRGMIGPDELAAMKDTAILINVARGEVIQEEPFYQALKTRQIAGAVIDTWYLYPARGLAPGEAPQNPAPSSCPFTDLENVMVTPHCSAHSDNADYRRMISIASNLDKLARGEMPDRVMVRGTGVAA